MVAGLGIAAPSLDIQGVVGGVLDTDFLRSSLVVAESNAAHSYPEVSEEAADVKILDESAVE